MRITLEMPAVAAREMRECACNADDSCRAAAIRMGYGTLPSCDTMVPRTASINPDQAVLAGVGVFALVLSAFLVLNTISAVLAQQKRQIGAGHGIAQGVAPG